MGTCVEEDLVLVREGDVDYDGCRNRQQTIPQRRPKFPGIVRCEMFEDEGFVDISYRLEL